jgi:alpha-L-fucosidase
MMGDWYARNMYIQGHQQNLYHVRHYGHPSKFGYKDIVNLWKAENFDPEGLMDLYVKAGAKYFFAQASHHDNFFNYDSKVHRFNSVNYGPHKDIVALWQAAARRRGLKFGISEHIGASFEWLTTNKGCDAVGPYAGVPYDGCDKRYEDLYLDNAQYLDLTKPRRHYTHDERWPPVWYRAVREMVDMFEPDMLYSDGAIPFYKRDVSVEDPTYRPGLCMTTHLYNKSVACHGENQAIYMQKDSRPEFYGIGLLDIERSLTKEIAEKPWQTDTCLGQWFYDAQAEYKTFDQVIGLLVDIVAKNGNLLLNIPQRPDGTIDDDCRYVLEKLAAWFAVCGEAIYATRPYTVYGEGPNQVPVENRAEGRGMAWTPYDFRYTRREGTVYAFIMGSPRTVVLHRLENCVAIRRVRLLGAGEIPFSTEAGVLAVKMPDKMPLEFSNCLAIES